MRTRSKLLFAVATVGVAIASAGSARATGGFPAEIQSHLSLSYTPDCHVCHAGGTGQAGNTTTPFVKALLARGLVKYDSASLDTALDALAAEGTDSNHDGIADVQGLKDGVDPSVDANGPALPDYGCATARGASSSLDASGLFALALAAFVVARRKRA